MPYRLKGVKGVGRLASPYCLRNYDGNRRETRLLGILSFIHSTVWKVLFGKVADSLEKGTEHEDEYMISEKELLVNRFDGLLNFIVCSFRYKSQT